MGRREPLCILVVDDDADTRANMRDILALDQYRVEEAASIGEVLRRKDWQVFSAIILDRRLPDGTAEQLLPRLRELAPDAAVIIVTGYADLEGSIAALRLGASDYILKPIHAEALRASLARVAERQRLAEEKQRSEAVFRTLVEAAPCAILILRPDHSIVYFSPFAEELTGYRASDVLGRDYVQLFLSENWHRPVTEEMSRVFSGVPCRGYEHPVVCRDGSQRWMVWNSLRLEDYEGEPALLAVGQDITRVKEAQERALQAERLAAIGQMMTGLAHESGNALARSQACLELLSLELQGRPEALDLIARIQAAQDHLRQLYDEVRNYAAPLRLERERWDLRGLWQQAWINLAVRREGRQAHLIERTNGLDLHCRVDAFRLEQVFRNIFENSLAACKDPVEITIECAETSLEGRPAVRLRLVDNGPGLSPEQQRRIFEPFFTTKTKGTGLGMAIAKRIIDAHQGQIAAGIGCPGAEILITLPRDSS